MRIPELDSLLQDKKALWVTLFVSLLYIVPILLADYEYQDDFGRNLFGYGWQHDGRFIATLLGKLWSFNSAIYPIYPFSLLLSSLVLGFTGYLVVSLFGIEDGKTLKWSSLLIITSPAYLGNLVYKFDCLPMSLSLLAVVFPFVFYQSKRKFVITSIAGVFLSFGLYQSSATVFLMVGSVFLIQELTKNDWKGFFYNVIYLIASFCTAFLGYMTVIKIWGLDISQRSSLIVGSPDFMELLAKNNGRFLERISLIVRSGNYKYLASLFLLFTLVGLGYFIYSKKDTLKELFVLPMILLIVAVNFWLISSVNILLADTYWDLRTFCGLGFFLLVLAFFQKGIKNAVLQKMSRVSMGLLVLLSFVIIAQFGRALTNQTQFQDDFIADIKPYLNNNPIKKIGLLGSLTPAPKNYFIYSAFPLFENHLQSPIGQFAVWNKEVLNVNGTLDTVEIIKSDELKCKGKVFKESRFYTIRILDGETLIIDFNRNKCPE